MFTCLFIFVYPQLFLSNSVKEINRLRKEFNMLLGKGMSNMYLEFTIETSLKLWYSGLKNLSTGQFWGAPTHADIIEF